MSKKLIIIIAAVFVLAGGAGGYYFYSQSGGDDAAAAAEAKAALEKPAILDMDAFLTNISDPNGEHHARVQVKLAVAPEERVAEIKADELLMVRLRDQILSMLTAKTYKDLSDPEGKEQFRAEIRSGLQPLLETGEIKEVFFSDFIVQ